MDAASLAALIASLLVERDDIAKAAPCFSSVSSEGSRIITSALCLNADGRGLAVLAAAA